MASTVLTRTPSSNGSQRIMTFSAWVKLDITTSNAFFSTGSSGSALFSLYFTNASKLQMEYYNGSTNYYLRTNRLFRDVNAWYHIVMVLDTTQATEANRMRIYVNGTEETSFEASQYPTQNFDVQYINSTSYSNKVGNNNGANFFNGKLAHVHYVDGTAYTPSTFGETDATTGIWKPKTAPSVTYGTNGFFLKFDNSANMGLDSSGQSNNLTTSGPIIQNKDTPSNVFACLNAVLGIRSGGNGNVMALSNNNTTMESSDSAWRAAQTTLAVSSGKYYCELKFKVTGSGTVYAGIWSMEDFNLYNSTIGDIANGVSYNLNTGQYSNAGSLASYGDAFSAGDILGIAIDLDNNKAYFSRNGTWQNSGVPTSGATGTGALNIVANKTYAFGASCNPSGSSSSHSWNFGNGYFGTTAVSSAQSPDDGNGVFEYDVPAGYRALCTKSINAEEYS